jgi:hypothetical protein
MLWMDSLIFFASVDQMIMSDLADKRHVTVAESEDYQVIMAADSHFETSALKGENSQKMFARVAKSVGFAIEPEQPDYLAVPLRKVHAITAPD